MSNLLNEALLPQLGEADNFIDIVRDIRGSAADLVLAAQDPNCIYGDIVIKYNSFMNTYGTAIRELVDINSIATELTEVTDMLQEIESLYADRDALNSLYAAKVTLDRLHLSIDNVDMVVTNVTNIDTVANNIVDVNSTLANAQAAQTAQGLAEGARDVAIASKNATNADVVLTNADVVATASNLVAIEGIYDTFEDRYLGSFSSDPTLDNDDNALLIGAMYFNTSVNSTKFYNGVTWEDPEATATAAALTTTQDALATAADVISAGTSATTATTKAGETSVSATAAETARTNAVTAKVAAQVAGNSAQLSAWEAEADRMTANSYTTEAEDVLVKSWISNGDGTFTAADTVEYSASHYAAKVEADKVQTGDDRVQTGDDRVQTGDDRVQTGDDRVSSAASADSASTSATASEVSRLASEVSNVSANAAKDTAVASADFVDNLMLGAKASDPTTDNDGGALQESAMYYNTVAPKQLKVWDGASWQVAAFDATGVVLSFNGRDGVITLSAQDVNAALGFTAIELTKASVDALGINATTLDGIVSAELVKCSSQTGAAKIPKGTTAERDTSPEDGYFRFNTDLKDYEKYDSVTGLWLPIGGGATGGGNDDIFYENSQIVTQDYTITTGKNAMSAGTVEIASGVTVEIPAGSTWTIV